MITARMAPTWMIAVNAVTPGSSTFSRCTKRTKRTKGIHLPQESPSLTLALASTAH
jgi:hypothetical protein